MSLPALLHSPHNGMREVSSRVSPSSSTAHVTQTVTVAIQKRNRTSGVQTTRCPSRLICHSSIMDKGMKILKDSLDFGKNDRLRTLNTFYTQLSRSNLEQLLADTFVMGEEGHARRFSKKGQPGVHPRSMQQAASASVRMSACAKNVLSCSILAITYWQCAGYLLMWCYL